MQQTDLPLPTMDPIDDDLLEHLDPLGRFEPYCDDGERLERLEPYPDDGARDLDSLVVVLQAGGRYVTPELLAAADVCFREIAPGEPCPCGSGTRYKRCCGRSR